MQRLVDLMTDTLGTSSPLTVEHVPPVGTKKEDHTPWEERKPNDLTATGRATRLAFLAAIARRVADQRYGSGLYKHSHLFAIAMLLNPVGRSLKYLDRIKISTIGKTDNFTADASVVKATVVEQFTDLVTQAVQARKSEEEAKGADGEVLREKRGRRSKGGESTTPLRMEQLRNASMFDSNDGSEGGDCTSSTQLSPREEAKGLVTKWFDAKVRTVTLLGGGNWPSLTGTLIFSNSLPFVFSSLICI